MSIRSSEFWSATITEVARTVRGLDQAYEEDAQRHTINRHHPLRNKRLPLLSKGSLKNQSPPVYKKYTM